jgi:hypothetical protein
VGDDAIVLTPSARPIAVRAFVLLLALPLSLATATSGCVVPPERRCSSCRVLEGPHPTLPPLKPGTERLFVLVPGLLGYGWEWDAPVERLRRAPGVDFVVFWWQPWGSIDRAAHELAALLTRLQASAPPSLRELVVVTHSAAGLVGAHALGFIAPPAIKLTLVTIGAPFAGMHFAPWSEVDVLHAPLMLAIGTRFAGYPQPPPGVAVIEYVTTYPPDPVMHPYWGSPAAPLDIGPAGARRIAVDPALGHNFVVDKVVGDLLAGQQ